MLFNIQHRTHYSYSHPVRLSPQQLRFYPRCDGSQRVVAYQLNINPAPQGQNEYLDLEGNHVTQIWFDGETQYFEIEVKMQVQTLRKSASDFILAPTAMHLPIRHDQDSICVAAYLERSWADDAVTAFAAQLSMSVDRDTLRFLDRLNRYLHEEFIQIHRHSGAPQAPAFTLQTRHGACRDLAVLFVDCCRAEGLAARFASGYQKGDLQSDRRDLHAWPEVYLPGAGWRGWDPTHGFMLADTHVVIAAAANAEDTLPVSGAFEGSNASSVLNFDVQIQVED